MRKIVIRLIALVLLAVLIAWIWYDNNNLGVTEYTLELDTLPEAFDGYKIVQLSDLHGAEFGDNEEALIELVEKEAPDIIVLTGDISDTDSNINEGVELIEGILPIAPVYYIPGNHEARYDGYEIFKNTIEHFGVTVLDNSEEAIEINGESIYIAGIYDPLFASRDTDITNEEYALVELNKMERKGFTVLLSHRPELIEVYSQSSLAPDVVFSGHAHGGQFRIPFVGGIYAPGQGLFPKYAEGVFSVGNTNMIVSRGLGNGTFPFRINNPPEIISVTLKCR